MNRKEIEDQRNKKLISDIATKCTKDSDGWIYVSEFVERVGNDSIFKRAGGPNNFLKKYQDFVELEISTYTHSHGTGTVSAFRLINKKAGQPVNDIAQEEIPFEERKFDIAFSFPGEKREQVREIVELLKTKGVKSIFFDDDFDEELAVPGMDLRLKNIYRNQSKLLCVFLCKEYEEKKWCRIEWHSIREVLSDRRPDQILFLRSDDAEVTGVSSNDGYIDVKNYSPEELAQQIIKRLRRLE